MCIVFVLHASKDIGWFVSEIFPRFIKINNWERKYVLNYHLEYQFFKSLIYYWPLFCLADIPTFLFDVKILLAKSYVCIWNNLSAKNKKGRKRTAFFLLDTREWVHWQNQSNITRICNQCYDNEK